jgi:gamma-glutamyltranspeptidase/glutathione hydrolase
MLIWLNEKNKALAINYRENAPLASDKNMFLTEDATIDHDKTADSLLASGVPGTVAGLLLAHQKYGQLSRQKVMQPAIKLAEEGFEITRPLARSLKKAKKRLQKNPATKAKFFKNQSQLYQQGDLWRQPDLADTLRKIAQHGKEGFYRGATAQKIVDYMNRHNGLINLKDLKNYQAEMMKPVQGKYHNHTIYAMPPPSSGGVTLIQILNTLKSFPITELGLNSARTIHIMAEAMNYAYADRNKLLADPDKHDNPVAELTSKAYADKIAHKIHPFYHTPPEKITAGDMLNQESKQTTHFSIADNQGNMVANTYTLNFSFGNAHVVPGTGMLLNNEMGDFSVKPGVANAYGLVQGKANQIAPGKQPLSSMAPTLVVNPNNKPYMATGSPGGSRIITTVLQVILNTIDHHLNLQSAVNAPRIHSQYKPDQLFVEQGISPDTITKLKQMGYSIKRTQPMGAAESIKIKNGQLKGAVDPRKPGGKVSSVKDKRR